MNSVAVVSVQRVSKAYRLFNHQSDRLKKILLTPFKINVGSEFWALQDVSCEVFPGETVGIIGKNGSGKSTLLQIIAGILRPTQGTVNCQGRLSALLELAAGFSPEFTGRENIFLNGAILGIPEKEMKQRQEQIVDFAQIGDFIDQPVKLYSSGMYVRLAFSIATSVEPDILIVDEALAVGDVGFIARCMQRMKQLKDNGTTVLLVSHDIQAVRTLCDRVLWLHDGRVKGEGATLDVTSQYVQFLFSDQAINREQLSSKISAISESDRDSLVGKLDRSLKRIDSLSGLVRWGSGEIQIEGFRIDSSDGSQVFSLGDRVHLEIQIRAAVDIQSTAIGVGFGLQNSKGLHIISVTTIDEKVQIGPLQAGNRIRFIFEWENIVAPGDYALVLNIEDRSTGAPQYYDYIENVFVFTSLSDKNVYSVVLPKVDQRVIYLK
jgi:lipopolysaccharide transport system ATP-binding protein